MPSCGKRRAEPESGDAEPEWTPQPGASAVRRVRYHGQRDTAGGNWRHLHLDAATAEDMAQAAEVLSQVLGMLAERARGALEADGADVDVLIEWAHADMADELT